MIELIKSTIRLNDSICRNGIAQKHLHPLAYMKEFRTIHINAGRQTGKTQAMLHLARPRDLIIVHNLDNADRLRSHNQNCLAPIMSVRELIIFSQRQDIICDYVWLDEPEQCMKYQVYSSHSYFNTTLESLIYNKIKANLIIKLGQ